MRLIIFIGLIVAINCQQSNSGFQLDPYKILGVGGPSFNNGLNNNNNNIGGSNMNNGMNNGMNSGMMNRYSDSGLSSPMMGMIMGGNNQQPQPQPPQNQVTGLPSINSYPGQNIRRLPFSDDLQYPSNPPPVPVPSAPVSTPYDYKQPELRRTDYITSPGNLAEMPQIKPIPDALASNRVSMTANLFNTQAQQGSSGYGLLSADNLFPPVPLNPQSPPNQRILNRIANDFNWGTKYFGNLLGNNRPNLGPSNNGLSNNGLYDNGGYYNSGLNNNGLNLATSASSAYPVDNKLPIEISEYSTKITHEAPARAALQPTGPYKLNRSK